MPEFVCLQCGKPQNSPGHLGENVCFWCRQERTRREHDAKYERATAAKHQREMHRLQEKGVAQQRELLELQKREVRALEASRATQAPDAPGRGRSGSDGLKGMVVLIVGVLGFGWYGWAIFFGGPAQRSTEATAAPLAESPTGTTDPAATSEAVAPPPPSGDDFWCVCFREGDDDEVIDVTACRPSESACERLERSARSSSGSRAA